MKTSKKYLYPLTIFLIALAVCLLSIKKGHQWGDDFAQYFAQARAIYLGTTAQFVKDNTFVVLTSPIDMATPVYPWGFTLLLSLFYPLFGENIVLYKIITAVTVALISVLLYFFLDRYIEDKELSFVISLAFGLDYFVLKFVNNVTSDMLFLLLCFLCYLPMKDYFKEEPDGKKLLLMGLVMGYSYMVRSQGIALILSYVICEAICFLRDRKVNYRRLLPYAGIIVVLALDKLLLPHGERSSLYFLESMDIATFIDNIRYYFFVLEGLMPVPYSLQRPLYLAVLILAIIGIVQIVRKKESVLSFLFIVLSFLMFTGINLLFPWHQGARYMLPCYPLLLLLAAYGISYVFEMIKNRKVILLAEAGMLIVLCAYGVHSYAYYNIANRRGYDKGAYTDEALELYDFVENETEEDAVFCFFKPRAFYMKTGKLVYKPIAMTKEYLKDADYLIECDEDDYVRIVAVEGVDFEKVFENDRLTVYRLIH